MSSRFFALACSLSILFGPTALEAASKKQLPSQRSVLARTSDGSLALATVPIFNGLSMDYPSVMTVDAILAEKRLAGVRVYDVRFAEMSLPMPTAPWRTPGFDIATLVAATEFADIPDAVTNSSLAGFLLFLTDDAEVVETSALIELRYPDGAMRSYELRDILPIKEALTSAYDVTWITE